MSGIELNSTNTIVYINLQNVVVYHIKQLKVKKNQANHVSSLDLFQNKFYFILN